MVKAKISSDNKLKSGEIIAEGGRRNTEFMKRNENVSFTSGWSDPKLAQAMT